MKNRPGIVRETSFRRILNSLFVMFLLLSMGCMVSLYYIIRSIKTDLNQINKQFENTENVIKEFEKKGGKND